MKTDSTSLVNILKEVDAISIKEVALTPEDDGIWIYAMDPSMTVIVSARMKSTAFPEGCSIETESVVPVPFMLDALDKDGVCDLVFEDGNVIVKYAKSKRTRRLVACEDGPRPVPGVELTDTCAVMSDDLISLIKMSCFQNITTDSGGITVKLVEGGMVFEALSETESAVIGVEGTTAIDEEKGEATSIFGMKVIAPILKALPKSTVLTISMLSNRPMKISIDEDKYMMDIFVAPFIMEDD